MSALLEQFTLDDFDDDPDTFMEKLNTLVHHVNIMHAVLTEGSKGKYEYELHKVKYLKENGLKSL
jgi:hypothetical protein